MINGWIILDKPLGLGSTQAVAAVKRNLREAGFGKGTKVGHGGTLDPLATGVLPIALGEATKLCGRMLDASKTYSFTIEFGVETDTLDLEGEIVARSAVRPTQGEVETALRKFRGEIEQVPPTYSAVKIDGERAYNRARAGEEFSPKSRRVEIKDLLTTSWRRVGSLAFEPSLEDFYADSLDDAPREALELDEVSLLARVSKGTYIRSLARDISRAVGTVGRVTALRRVQAGPFSERDSISLDKLNELGKGAPLEAVLRPFSQGLVGIPALVLSPEQAILVRQGQVLTGLPHRDGLYWATTGVVPLALVELAGESLTVVRGFNLPDVAE